MDFTFRESLQVQIKHAKNFSRKHFGARKPPAPKFFTLAFCLYFDGKRGPKHKEFCGVRSLLEGGSGRGVSGEILFVYALSRGLITL